MKRIIFCACLLALCSGLFAQPDSGSRKYDGEHKNEVSGYLLGGHNVVSGAFAGESFTYTRHLTDRWSVSGGEQIQFFKQLYCLDAMGTYRVPLRYGNIYFDARVLLNRYQRWGTTEFAANLSAYWETSYVDMRVGASYLRFNYTGVKPQYRAYTGNSYTELPLVTFGFGVNIRPRSNPWNLGLFIRNYEHYMYDIWNINWGVRFYARLSSRSRLFGEFCVRPAGSLSQLATRYETSANIGLRYAW